MFALLIFAFVLGKLNRKVLLRFRHPLQCGHGNLKFLIALRAYRDHRSSADPLQHAKMAFWHGWKVRTKRNAGSTAWFLRSQKSSPAASILLAASGRPLLLRSHPAP